jgi:1-phosphofructokinase family hexose kinase
MILALNLNAALDKIFFIERFLPTTHMRVSKAGTYIGGKGLDAALVLQTLGAPTLAISFMAGSTGKILAGLLDDNQIAHELIWLAGDTRESVVLIEKDFHRHSHFTTCGYTVTREDCDLFLNRMAASASQAEWSLMAGSLPIGTPPDFYAEMIALLQQHGVMTLIDHSGPGMLEAIKKSPDIVKMNQTEFQETFQVQLHNPEDWAPECRRQMSRFKLKSLAITCGKDGILAFTPEGDFKAGLAQEIVEINAAGAGDAVSAALVYYLSLGNSWPQSLLWAIATSAAVVLTEGTAVCHMADILAIYPNAWVKNLEGA